jgi:peptidoglycan/xylan/chitin deacetylase (PgdA/CDA1 family)
MSSVRRSAGIAALGLGVSLALSACSAAPSPPTPTIEGSGGGRIVPPRQVFALANAFVGQFAAGEYALQWGELAPQAQAMWPSSAARAAMLANKFAHAEILSISLGTPTLESTWTVPEHPDERHANVWSLPLHVRFASPQSLRPVGVAALFSMSPLQIVTNHATGRAAVVGEGPASMDAPIIIPPTIPALGVDVPILMYHLIDQIPPRSIEPSNYGWQLEMGLTTLPGAFDAQMAYLMSIHATSISLQHLADALLYGLPLPRHPVVITFDDGRLSPWTNAVPVLRRDGYTAVFFPCTGLLGGRTGPQTYMTTTDIQELAASGFSVEDHTINDAVNLFSAGAGTVYKLTDRTKTVLENLSGAPVQFIAYSGVWPWPHANQGATHETSLFATLAGYGYVGGVLDVRVNSATDSGAMLWQLPRVRIGLSTTPAWFAHWFSAQPA